MKAETKILEAAESFERTRNVTSGLKAPPFIDPVANRKTVGAVTKEMAGAITDDMSEVLVVDAPKGKVYRKLAFTVAISLMANQP
jgi:hypothetical protein